MDPIRSLTVLPFILWIPAGYDDLVNQVLEQREPEPAGDGNETIINEVFRMWSWWQPVRLRHRVVCVTFCHTVGSNNRLHSRNLLIGSCSNVVKSNLGYPLIMKVLRLVCRETGEAGTKLKITVFYFFIDSGLDVRSHSRLQLRMSQSR